MSCRCILSLWTANNAWQASNACHSLAALGAPANAEKLLAELAVPLSLQLKVPCWCPTRSGRCSTAAQQPAPPLPAMPKGPDKTSGLGDDTKPNTCLILVNNVF